MKRRKFISRIGAGSSVFLLGSAGVEKQKHPLAPFQYFRPSRFSEVLNQQGLFQLRLEILAVEQLTPRPVILEVENPAPTLFG